MEKLESALCQWIVLHTHYKPNNTKTKSSTKFKSYFQIYLDKEKDKHSTLDPHGA